MTQEHTPGQGLPIGSTARRRVAAWNACEGIPTEALEAGVVADMLEALESILKIPNSDAAHGITKVIASAAIARAKVGAS